MKNHLQSFFRENKSLLLFITLMMVFRSAVADWNDVPTGSMKPTIVEGDRIFVNKMAYDLRLPFTQTSVFKLNEPKRNDIVIFESTIADKRLVKRVIGIPGDRIALHNNQLVLNGKMAVYKAVNQDSEQTLSSEIIAGNTRIIRTTLAPGKAGTSKLSSFPVVTVPAGYYLVMGDNRDNSADSRVIGFVPRNEIIGQSSKVVLSLDYENYLLPRSGRFFKEI